MIWKTAGMAFVGAVALAACGGGGGGGSSPSAGFPDELGSSGQATGTVTIPGSEPFGFPTAVTLDGRGRGLVVGSTDQSASPSRTPFVWQASDSNGQWSSPISFMPALSDGTFALRSNSEGSSVLAVSNPPRVLRYEPATGWEPAAVNIPSSGSSPRFEEQSDLAILSDGSVVLSSAGPATTPSPGGSKTTSHRVLRHRASGWETLFETEPFEIGGPWSYLTVNPDATAMLFWMEGESQPAGGIRYTLHLKFLNVLAGPASLGSFAFSAGVYTPCSSSSATAVLTAANSPTNFKVVALLHGDPASSRCNLDIIRVDFNGIDLSTSAQRLNTSDSGVPRRAFVAMNQRGDAMVTWVESPAGNPRRLWSQSLRGGPFSVPQPVLADTATLGEIAGAGTSFAANAAGQVVGTEFTNKDQRGYLVTGRFSFEMGWKWQFAANNMTSGPFVNQSAVAINGAGDGLLVYSAIPCERLPAPGPGISVRNCRALERYALKF